MAHVRFDDLEENVERVDWHHDENHSIYVHRSSVRVLKQIHTLRNPRFGFLRAICVLNSLDEFELFLF